MGPISVREYAAAMRRRYELASKVEKGLLLDEFCTVTSYHRKAAVRLLRQEGSSRPRRGRPKRYGPAEAAALRQVWEASDRLGSKRLAPFVAELLEVLERHKELTLEPVARARLEAMSASTMDRLLRSGRPQGWRRPHRLSPAEGSLRAQVPVRTFGEWAGVTAGSVQADLVLHCAESTQGFYLATLVVVDVATGWTECEPTWGLGQDRVRGALERIRRRLPFLLRELHTDNGSEFLNRTLYPYCQQHAIRMTRGRPYKKNDQAYVEQKNWSVVRRLVGYDRYGTKAAYEQLQRLYVLVRAYVNCFQPVAKLMSKERAGAKVTKRYDLARTPYQRVVAAGVLEEVQQGALKREYQRLNPMRLRTDLHAGLEALWALAVRPRTAATPPQGNEATPPVDKWTTPTCDPLPSDAPVAHLPTGPAVTAVPSVTDL